MAEDVVAELDAELALIEELPYRVPIHLLAKRARDEIVALREQLDHAATHGSGFTGILAGAVSAEAKRWVKEASVQVRDEALEEAVRAIDGISWDWPSPRFDDAEAFKAAIRALKEKGRDPR